VQKQYDDLFESSKMSFGEHLEELRSALFKAIIVLFVGFLVGLYFANDMVLFVKVPLQNALDEFQMNRVQESYLAELEDRQKDGSPISLPPRLEGETDDELLLRAARMYADEGLIPKTHTIDVDEAKRLGWKVDPEQARELSDGRRVIDFTEYSSITDDPRRDLISTQITGGFSVFMKAAFVVGLIISSPFVFLFIWQFVAAGLYPHERRYVYIFLPFSLALFWAGAALAFFGAIYYVLQFLFLFYRWLDVSPYLVINDWLGFILILPIGFGISFQLPLVMLFLERIGLFTVPTYLKQWRMAVLVICILSTVLTPADPQSMILMAVPLIFLYFGGIALCHYFPRRRTPFGDVIAKEGT
jgi:sec-independent protein translocase protein TatC